MDQYLSAIIISVITGIFSIITIKLNQKTNKIDDKINKRNVFNEKEKALKQKLNQKKSEQENIIHDIMILILDSNIEILQNVVNAGANIDTSRLDRMKELSDKYKADYKNINDSIEDIRQEYEIMLDVAHKFQEEIDKLHSNKKSTDE